MKRPRIKYIPGFKGYYATENGNIWCYRRYRKGSKRQFKKLNAVKNKTEYLQVRVEGKYYLIHRLILIAFRGEPEPGQITRHLDGEPTNNRLDNLTWGTHKENSEDMMRHGTYKRGPNNNKAVVTKELVEKVWELHNRFYPISKITKELNLSTRTVNGIVHLITYTYWAPSDAKDWIKGKRPEDEILSPLPQKREEEGIDPIFGTDLPL